MEWEHDDTVRTVLRRARILRTDDSGTQQRTNLAGLASERPEKIIKIQPHGFSSVSPGEAEGILMQLAGRSDRSVFFGGEHRDKRPRNLPEGASAMYDAFNKILKMTEDETILDAGNKPVTIRNATKVKIEGNDGTFGVNGRWYRVRQHRVDIGVTSPTGEAPYAVETTGGPSSIVFAVV